jgi:hypothetical protein
MGCLLTPDTVGIKQLRTLLKYFINSGLDIWYDVIVVSRCDCSAQCLRQLCQENGGVIVVDQQ